MYERVRHSLLHPVGFGNFEPGIAGASVLRQMQGSALVPRPHCPGRARDADSGHSSRRRDLQIGRWDGRLHRSQLCHHLSLDQTVLQPAVPGVSSEVHLQVGQVLPSRYPAKLLQPPRLRPQKTSVEEVLRLFERIGSKLHNDERTGVGGSIDPERKTEDRTNIGRQVCTGPFADTFRRLPSGVF